MIVQTSPGSTGHTVAASKARELYSSLGMIGSEDPHAAEVTTVREAIKANLTPEFLTAGASASAFPNNSFVGTNGAAKSLINSLGDNDQNGQNTALIETIAQAYSIFK